MNAPTAVETAPPRPVRSRPPRGRAARAGAIVVHKFGGAALATAAGMAYAAALVRRAATERTGGVVVVTSASGDTTDALLAVARAAPLAPEERLRAEILRLRQAHERLAEIVDERSERAALQAVIDESFDELARLVTVARTLGELGPREVDRVLARGERLSAAVLAATLRTTGVAATTADAAALIPTDGRHGAATPDMARVRTSARRLVLPLLRGGQVVVVPGFLGGSDTGAVVTLGRGGSDLTATVLAVALGGREVVLWKDVPGFLTADPRIVPAARVLAQLNLREAAELACYGARVLHPRALVPLGERMQVRVRPFAEPEAAGTEISRRRIESRVPVRAIAATMDQALVRVLGQGLRSSPGLLARVLGALHEAQVDAALVSQAVTEYGVTLTVPGAAAGSAVAALRRALAPELALGELTEVSARLGVATVGIVGLGLGAHPDAVARAFRALAAARIAVLATAQGADGASVSLVVDATRAAEAQNAVHAAFELHRPGGGRVTGAAHRDVVLLGVGAIGRELLGQLAVRARGDGARLRVCAVVDRSGYVFDPRGLSRTRLQALCAHKQAGGALVSAAGGEAATTIDAIERVMAHALSRPVVVDATAAETSGALEAAVARGCDVVLANKIPLAAPQAAVDRLWALAHRHGRRVLYEATVGAGLPVIDTMHKLLDAGDRVIRIEGCPSGTLGFLFGELGRGRAFSAALRDAVAAGYAEPDPRVDLAGIDVARKALILARPLGFRGDLADIAVESLVPSSLRDVPPDEFLARAEECDAAWAARTRAAGARGRVLRYRVRVTRRAVSVGIVAVPLTDPLGALHGTDNQFAFTTARYRTQPLVITGPGAGAAVTAAGVYNDLLQLAAGREGREGREARHGATRRFDGGASCRPRSVSSSYPPAIPAATRSSAFSTEVPAAPRTTL